MEQRLGLEVNDLFQRSIDDRQGAYKSALGLLSATARRIAAEVRLQESKRRIQALSNPPASLTIRPLDPKTMGYSLQRFIIADDDTLYRVATTSFDRMLHEPSRHRLPEFAGQRVRSTEVVVQLAEREPVAVVRRSFSVLAFDLSGCLDATRHLEQQFARIETALAPVFSSEDRGAKVVPAASRFIAQGGSWSPSVALQRVIDETALRRRKCQRLTPTGGLPDGADR